MHIVDVRAPCCNPHTLDPSGLEQKDATLKVLDSPSNLLYLRGFVGVSCHLWYFIVGRIAVVCYKYFFPAAATLCLNMGLFTSMLTL